MTELRSLCVYCGSSSSVDATHLDAARKLGRLAAEQGVGLVFGGGRVGIMGVLADACMAAGGKVIGVIPQSLDEREVGHRDVTDLEIVDTMHVRKMRMFELSDAFCVLPGGLGTLDETFEIITWRQLKIHDKPIIVVNLGGYWDPLLALIDHQIAQGYVRPEYRRLFSVVDTPEAVFDAVAQARRPKEPSHPERI
jgi:uncharacterized protein (TIGR00730 family)